MSSIQDPIELCMSSIEDPEELCMSRNCFAGRQTDRQTKQAELRGLCRPKKWPAQ